MDSQDTAVILRQFANMAMKNNFSAWHYVHDNATVLAIYNMHTLHDRQRRPRKVKTSYMYNNMRHTVMTDSSKSRSTISARAEARLEKWTCVS